MVGVAWSKVSFMLPSSECTNNGKGHINNTDRIHKQGLSTVKWSWDCWFCFPLLQSVFSGHQHLIIISLTVVKSGHKHWITESCFLTHEWIQLLIFPTVVLNPLDCISNTRVFIKFLNRKNNHCHLRISTSSEYNCKKKQLCTGLLNNLIWDSSNFMHLIV